MAIRTIIKFWVIFLLLVGCQKTSEIRQPPANQKTTLLATTSLIADAVKVIAGDSYDVQCLMGPAIDPHRYVPTAKDIRRLEDASVIFYHGLHLEGKMVDILEGLGQKKATFSVTRTIEKKLLRPADSDNPGISDPHVWFDVSLWIIVVEQISKDLCQQFPANQAIFEKNAQAYLTELKTLHEDIKKQLAGVPRANRYLFTSHDAFGYFGAAYGFQVYGLQGVSTATEAGSKDVTRLAEQIGELKIPVLFAESSVPDRGIKAVQQAVEKKYGFSPRLSQKLLYSDALGDEGGPAGTYILMVQSNVAAIGEALGPR
jgi:manganese/zinc/iron transport system substrate-binding protein